MGTEDYHHIIGNFIDFINKYRAAISQLINHKFVMNHFVPHIHRGTKLIERQINNINGTIYACTETSGVSQFNIHR